METQNKFRVEIRISEDSNCNFSHDTNVIGKVFAIKEEAKDECLSIESWWQSFTHKHSISVTGYIVEIDVEGNPIGDDLCIWRKIDKPVPDTCPTRYTGKWING